MDGRDVSAGQLRSQVPVVLSSLATSIVSCTDAHGILLRVGAWPWTCWVSMTLGGYHQLTPLDTTYRGDQLGDHVVGKEFGIALIDVVAFGGQAPGVSVVDPYGRENSPWPH